jgi:aminopeptidase
VAFTPSEEHLERYARLLVDFALGGGTGIKRGEVVSLRVPEVAKPLYVALSRAVWRSGGHVIPDFRPDDDATYNLSRDFFELADEEQLDFFPTHYRRAWADLCDHSIYIDAPTDPHALAGIEPAKLLRHQRARGPMVAWLDEKENAGWFTWTIALYGTEALAAEARMTLEEYWEQIIAACFLDEKDPAARWREVDAQIQGFVLQLNALQIDKLHVEGEDCDLWITVGERRRWVGGGGRNIPSFEVFTSPDWRGTEGWIRFSEPLYVHGSLITGIELEFTEGRVTRSSATEHGELLTEMLSTEGADRLGEFSLTDARLSRITRFMAETLYDENVGGPFGNTHVAVGRALQMAYDGDATALSEDDWTALGFNHSTTHTDIVSTTDRTVTATLRDGSTRVIYESGQFALDL